jgi:hypothetical protein
MEYVAGRPVVISIVCTDETDGSLFDPTALTLMIQAGNCGDPTTVTIDQLIRTGTGTYYYIFDTTGLATTVPVFFTYQWQATGTTLGISDPGAFTVLPPRISSLT